MPDPNAPHNPTAHRRFGLIVRTTCVGERCQLSRNQVTAYPPPNAVKAVITDWFHGGINHRHSCAAVHAALAMLPEEGDVRHAERGVRNDLQTYARTVC
jgi:hypothetical protein